MTLPSNYNPKENEDIIYSFWQKSGVGSPERQQKKQELPENSETYSILMPPPNLTGNLHAGHTFQHYLMDTLTRIAISEGKLSLWYPGVDHAGLQLEGVIDKLIRKGDFTEQIQEWSEKLEASKKEGLKNLEDKNDLPAFIKKTDSDFWLELAWSKVNEWRDNQKKQASILGDIPDYDRNLFTLDERNNRMVNYAFKQYWQDGLVYKGSYLINWSVGLQTALSDVSGEIEYETRIDPFITFEYRNDLKKNIFEDIPKELKEKVLNSLEKLKVSTVRPETIFGDVAIAIHPEKLVYLLQKGGLKEAEVNLVQESLLRQKIKLVYQIEHLGVKGVVLILDEEVDKDFGTGCLKITPGSDATDYRIFNKHPELGSDFPKAVGRSGKLTEECGEFAGMSREEARLQVIKLLLQNDYIKPKEDASKVEEFNNDPDNLSGEELMKYLQEKFADYEIDWNYEHNVSVCERTKTVIEPLISEEFFVSYHKKASSTGKSLQEHGLEGIFETNFYSEDYRERGRSFVEGIKDWCVSRNLLWGHRIPVWYNVQTNPEKRFFSHQEWQENALVFTNNDESLDQFPPTAVSGGEEGYILPNMNFEKEGKEVRVRDCFYVGDLPAELKLSGEWVQEEKIFDTWFSSCLWPLATLNYLDLLNKNEEPSASEKYYFVILHGFGGSSDANFFPWLKRELEAKGHEVWVPDLPNTELPGEEEQLNYILNNYQFNHKTVVIGHSLGAVLTLKLAEKVENLAGIALVAGFSQPKFVDNLPFPFADRFDWSFDFQRIKNNCGFINIYSDLKDCYVPLEQGRILKEKLGGNFYEYQAENTHFMQFRETKVLETVLNSLNEKSLGSNDFEIFYPTQTMTTAKEIFYLWIIRMIVLGKYFTSQLPEDSSVYNKIPFENVVITPTVLDEKGKKMSKSLGNGLDPVSQIEKYSSDSLRMALLGGMIPNRNMRMGGRLADEQCLKYRNYGNKIWNVARFLESKLDNLDSKQINGSLNSPSIWILQKFRQLEIEFEQNLQIYELAHNVEGLYKFLWDNYADWYVEYLKTDDSQIGFAVELFKRFLIRLYPYLPFETEVLWKEFILKHNLSDDTSDLLAFVQKDSEWSKRILEKNRTVSAGEFEPAVDFVKDLRSLRGLFAIDPGTEVNIYTKSKEILQFQDFIKLVAKAELSTELPRGLYKVNKGSYEYALDIFAYIKDRELEIKRTQKLIIDLQKQIGSLEKQLSNQQFLEKAGEEVVIEKKKHLGERKLELSQQEEKMLFLNKSK